MKIKFCPKCLSKNVEWRDSRMGAAEGNLVCNECGFYNIFFPEANNEKELKKLEKQI